MKCLQCEGSMRTRREVFDYGACGLPVMLHGVNVSRCARCGEHEVALTRIDELHGLIARLVIRKPARLSPPEIRFLRKWLGHSGEDLADIMGVTVEQISRWENGRRDIGAPADRLLRLVVANSAPRDDYSTDDLRRVQEKSSKPRPIDVRVSRVGWRPGSAA